MKREANFPASRELYRLVRHFADRRDPDERMSDVEIGRLIGFENARTSRWKHGQIAVADAPRLLALSHTLDIDHTVLSHVAAGYLSMEEALDLLESENKLVRFLGDAAVLPRDEMSLTLSTSDGSQCRVVRRAPGHYLRRSKRLTRTDTDDTTPDRSVLLADDDDQTVEAFRNLTGEGTGVVGIVARSGAEALILAGQLQPQLIVFDLFLGQMDGFAAIRALTTTFATRDAEIIATSLVVTPEIARTATGSGATDVLPRPLRARVLGRVIGKVRRRA